MAKNKLVFFFFLLSCLTFAVLVSSVYSAPAGRDRERSHNQNRNTLENAEVSSRVKEALYEDVSMFLDKETFMVICESMGGTWNEEEEKCELPEPPTAEEYCLQMGGEWTSSGCKFPLDASLIEQLKAELCRETVVSDGTCVYQNGRCICTAVACPQNCPVQDEQSDEEPNIDDQNDEPGPRCEPKNARGTYQIWPLGRGNDQGYNFLSFEIKRRNRRFMWYFTEEGWVMDISNWADVGNGIACDNAIGCRYGKILVESRGPIFTIKYKDIRTGRTRCSVSIDVSRRDWKHQCGFRITTDGSGDININGTRIPWMRCR